MAQLVTIDWRAAPAFFVTLTYHLAWGAPELWKRDVQAFRKRLERRWPVRGVVWRMEAQKRGAPHFHLAVFWRGQAPPLREFRAWCDQAWSEVVGERSSEQHARLGTKVVPVRIEPGEDGLKRLMLYLGKYLGKRDGAPWLDFDTGEVVLPGRSWGVWGEPPVASLGTVGFRSREGYARFLRRVRRHGAGSRYVRSLSLHRSAFLLLGAGLGLAQLLRGLDVEILRE